MVPSHAYSVKWPSPGVLIDVGMPVLWHDEIDEFIDGVKVMFLWLRSDMNKGQSNVIS